MIYQKSDGFVSVLLTWIHWLALVSLAVLAAKWFVIYVEEIVIGFALPVMAIWIVGLIWGKIVQWLSGSDSQSQRTTASVRTSKPVQDQAAPVSRATDTATQERDYAALVKRYADHPAKEARP